MISQIKRLGAVDLEGRPDNAGCCQVSVQDNRVGTRSADEQVTANICSRDAELVITLTAAHGIVTRAAGYPVIAPESVDDVVPPGPCKIVPIARSIDRHATALKNPREWILHGTFPKQAVRFNFTHKFHRESARRTPAATSSAAAMRPAHTRDHMAMSCDHKPSEQVDFTAFQRVIALERCQNVQKARQPIIAGK